ncbi:YraN family protein [bacterium]|nr:YraN family protein [bacterium]
MKFPWSRKTARADPRRRLGDAAERLATRHLEDLGYRILARNVVFDIGEIDIVAEHDGCVVVVEVKSAKESPGFSPADRVNAKKRKKLLSLARRFAATHRLTGSAFRFDIVSVVYPTAGEPRIDVYPRAFDAAGRPA